ncbi:FeoB-associated Cys-rich membrane protein [Rummeliibacillus pycnus]|nr:FeoB-associated Cys-rich membrane protein [Rummeliibacillus pycnus]
MIETKDSWFFIYDTQFLVGAIIISILLVAFIIFSIIKKKEKTK